MRIFSNTTEAFIKRTYPLLMDIITREMGLEIKRTRVFYGGFYYPVGLCIFQSKNQLGNFDSHNMKIGLNERLMWQSKESVIKDILRHELAHYMTFIVHQKHFHDLNPHGQEFREICQKFSWDESISKATLDVENANDQVEGDIVTEKLISKVKKLLELAGSSNKHEAELATIKANQLILQHNLDLLADTLKPGPHSEKEEVTFLERILFSKKNCAKLSAIHEALSSFQVALCFSHGWDGVYLEAVGPKASVEMAHYVAQFLDREMDTLWKIAKGENPHFKGVRVKNSFFKGIGQALSHKNKMAQATVATSRELVILKNNLKAHSDRAYNKLRTTRISGPSSYSAEDYEAHRLGKTAGEKLHVRSPLEKSGGIKEILRLS